MEKQDRSEKLQQANRLLDRNDLAGARAIYESMIENDPHDYLPYNKLGIIAVKEGRLDDALWHFEKALSLNPKSASAVSNIGNIYRERGDLDKAEEQYKLAIRLEPDNPIPHNNLAVIYKQKGDIGKFVATYKHAQRLERERQKETMREEIKTMKGNKKGCLSWLLPFGFILILLVDTVR